MYPKVNARIQSRAKKVASPRSPLNERSIFCCNDNSLPEQAAGHAKADLLTFDQLRQTKNDSGYIMASEYPDFHARRPDAIRQAEILLGYQGTPAA